MADLERCVFCGCAAAQTMTRSTNFFANLPNVDANIVAQGTSITIDLRAGGVYAYLFAKYDGRNDNSQVWYVGNLSGIITIPANGPRNHAFPGGCSLAQALHGFPMAAPQSCCSGRPLVRLAWHGAS